MDKISYLILKNDKISYFVQKGILCSNTITVFMRIALMTYGLVPPKFGPTLILQGGYFKHLFVFLAHFAVSENKLHYLRYTIVI